MAKKTIGFVGTLSYKGGKRSNAVYFGDRVPKSEFRGKNEFTPRTWDHNREYRVIEGAVDNELIVEDICGRYLPIDKSRADEFILAIAAFLTNKE